MGQDSAIEWTHHSMNGWWGCEKVSAGCRHCYADELDSRYHADDRHWGPGSTRKFFGPKHWAEPLRWDRAAARAGERHRVFAFSMADVFERRDDVYSERFRLYSLILRTPNLDWLLLTKRPENWADLLPWTRSSHYATLISAARRSGVAISDGPWPNVWLGITGENQEEWDRRREYLRDVDARVKFVSYEPALSDVDWRFDEFAPDWIIAGAESGRNARPAQLDWYRHARDQASQHGVSFFLKQHVETTASGKRKISLPVLDGVRHADFPEVR